MVNVLLADDNDRVRKVIAAILRADPRVRFAGEASSFAGLLRVGRTSKIDVVVMDLSMPEREGLRSDYVRGAIREITNRLIAASIWVDPVSVAKAHSYGAETLLDKASLGTQLLQAILNLG